MGLFSFLKEIFKSEYVPPKNEIYIHHNYGIFKVNGYWYDPFLEKYFLNVKNVMFYHNNLYMSDRLDCEGYCNYDIELSENDLINSFECKSTIIKKIIPLYLKTFKDFTECYEARGSNGIHLQRKLYATKREFDEAYDKLSDELKRLRNVIWRNDFKKDITYSITNRVISVIYIDLVKEAYEKL